jgi:UDP-N-acetylglucosamine--N-acetylmuramyl-(pentapeptide) pyrophosphoryl-undecaprenol N-acetylglucosamine transferase
MYGNALAAADIVVSRAGAGSIFEIAKAGKPSILIPLPEAAQNHQNMNAFIYSRSGAAIVMEEGNFTPNLFMEQLRVIANDQNKRVAMGQSAKDFAQADAAKTIAQEVYAQISN